MMDDDIVYYAGCEAHHYLERINMLNEGQEREVIETNQFLFIESDEETDKQMQSISTKHNEIGRQDLFALKVPVLGYLHLPIIIVSLLFGLFSLAFLKRGYFTMLILCGGIVLIFISSRRFKKEEANKNRVSAILKDLKDQIPQMKITSQQSLLIWKNIQKLLKPLMDIVSKRKIVKLCWRDKQFLQKQFYAEQQFHTQISVYKKLNKLSRIIENCEKQMHWAPRWENSLDICKKVYVFSQWQVEKAKIQPTLRRYIEIVLFQHSENMLDGGINEGDEKEQKRRSNKIYYSQLFSSIHSNLKQIRISPENSNQMRKQTKNLLSLLQLELQLKKSSFLSQNSQQGGTDSKYGETEENQHLFRESLAIKHLIDGNYQLNETGQTQFFANHQIPGQITYLRQRLDKILIKKIEQQQKKKEENVKQEKKREKIALYERERRVEGFGLLFQNVRPKKNVEQYYIE